MLRTGLCFLTCGIIFFAVGCRHHKTRAAFEPTLPLPPAVTERTGDEIVVCGMMFDTGAPVVLWTDPGGYDMYDAAAAATNPSTQPRRWRGRMGGLTDAEIERVRRDGWTLPLLQKSVDQFVIHYDVAGVSQTCFRVLKNRGLGVQFLLDIDGTIYQTMDLEHPAAHATKANGRSIGIEIANMGAYSGSIAPLMQWYEKDENGTVWITVPERLKGGGVRTPNFRGGPARSELVSGVVQGTTYRQYDYTPQQYDSLIKLTAALCTVFPKIQCDYPRLKSSYGSPAPKLAAEPGPATKPAAIAAIGEPGELIPHALSDDQYDSYQGVLGHYHVQLNKQDPGPAFQWDGVIGAARARMTDDAHENNRRMRNKPARFIATPSTESSERRGRGEWRSRRSATTQAATTTAAP